MMEDCRRWFLHCPMLCLLRPSVKYTHELKDSKHGNSGAYPSPKGHAHARARTRNTLCLLHYASVCVYVCQRMCISMDLWDNNSRPKTLLNTAHRQTFAHSAQRCACRSSAWSVGFPCPASARLPKRLLIASATPDSTLYAW